MDPWFPPRNASGTTTNASPIADLTPEDFGADPTGAADSTSALQAWVDELAAASVASSLFSGCGKSKSPAGTYKLSAPIQVPLCFGLELDFKYATLLQTGNNMPILEYTGITSHQFAVRRAVFKYATQQTPASPHSIALAFNGGVGSGGFYNWEAGQLYFQNCYRGIGQYDTTIVNPLWGFDIHHVTWDQSNTGACIKIEQTAAGQPRCSLRHLYMSGQANTTEELISMSAVDSLHMTDIEFIQYHRRVMLLGNVATSTLSGIRTEAGSLTTAFEGLICLQNGNYSISDLRTYNHTGGNNTILLRLINSGYVMVDVWEGDNITPSGATLWAVGGDNTGRLSVRRPQLTGPTAMVQVGLETAGVLDRWGQSVFIPTKAGIPTDADFAVVQDGQLCLDKTNSRLYVRNGGWHYAALT